MKAGAGRPGRRSGRVARGCAALAAVSALGVGACAPTEAGTLPTPDEVLSYYQSDREIGAELTGNVVVLTVFQSVDQLRRGGALWAKVGPYVYLFSDETKRLFEDFDGIAGVRVVTMVGASEVASALLRYGELSDVQWARALNIAGRARLEGTERMTLLEDLVDWGESHTEFTYNERYLRR